MMAFGPLEETELNIMSMLKDPKYSEAERRGALVEEVRNRLDIATLEDTEEIKVYTLGKYVKSGEQRIKAELQELGGFEITNHMRSEVIATIKAMTGVPRSAFDTDPDILNLKNGLLNIATGEFKEHTPEHLSMVQLPIEYRPGQGCPKIAKFLKETLEPEQVLTVVKILGYILLRSARYEKAFLLVGEGANGKSVFIKLIVAFVGKENSANVPLQELTEDKFASSNLYSKLVNVFADLKADRIKDTGYFKTLVSGDPTMAQKKHKDHFEFENYAKLVFSANQLPESSDKSYAFFRRLVIIPFNQTFEGAARDEHLIDKLTTSEELSGLLNVAIAGLKRLIRDGGFTDTDLEDVRQQYELGASKIQDFINECCILEPDNEDLSTATYDLQAALTRYCKSKGTKYVDIREFGEKLKALGIVNKQKRKHGTKERHYVGIGLKGVSMSQTNLALTGVENENSSKVRYQSDWDTETGKEGSN